MPQTKPSRLLFILTIGALSFGALFYFAQNRDSALSGTTDLKPLSSAHAGDTEGEIGGIANNPQPSPATADTQPQDSAPQSEIALSAEEQKKWDIFKSILNSNNDNDPRMDSQLKNLSANLHAALTQHYLKIPSEKRNQRGLVVYLIARDIQNIADLDFVRTVYEEAPCLSLEACGSRTASDPHLSSIEESTLNYPQLVGLYQLEKQLLANPKLLSDPNFKDRLLAAIQQASKFPVPAIQKKAEELLAKISQ